MFESRHFTVERLAEGVYAAIHRPGGWAIGNAGIIDLGEFTLVYDTFMTFKAAEDLLEAANQLTGSPVKIVVSSHYHNDHIWGNQVFGPQAFIISSTGTQFLIKTRGQEEYDWYLENSASELNTIQAQYDAESDEQKKQYIANWMSYYEGLVETMPDLVVRLPDVTFEEQLAIYGTARSVELRTFADGHTPSDTALFLASDGILFMSDLLFVNMHPFLADGDPDNLMRTLDQVAAYDASIFVPGHGLPGTKDDINLQLDYIAQCKHTVSTMLANGQEEEAIGEQIIPEPFVDWEFANFYAANLRYYYRKLTAADA
ncbi:MAG TPA: MBL fold metallo-hydrolase [candidate division Zixibacteria bacterium]|nr:MBL fold metallo-hydrolase [candidate division Zixibacteria bacterium]